ncbi:MAG: insulinase family protein [Planctomycetes bacterium]|nr:insulinase family protein [Planctomycetota bacterium]
MVRIPLVSLLTLALAAGLLGCAARAVSQTAGEPAAGAGDQAGPPATGEPLEVVRRQVNDRGVTVATLSNGATVIVQENHTVPVVTVQAYVRTGGMLEGPYLGTGVSHLLEHLVAKGATHEEDQPRPGDAAPQPTRDRLDEIGAQSNAYTTLDHTAYYINCASGRTSEALDILAGWMARPAIGLDDFQREHGVVQRELEMGRDNAARQMYYAHMANVYGEHPAGTPVIGHLGALRSLTYEDVLAYHARTYVPQRTVFVVAGDVDTAAVLDQLRTILGGWEASRSDVPVLPEVPGVAGVRRVVVPSEAVKDANEYLSFRTIPLIHEDLYALDVLSYILTNGASSRLNRIILRDKQLVTEIDSASWTPAWGAGEFRITFRTDPERIDAAEAEILAQVRRVADEGVTADELARAKRQKVADDVFSRQSVESQAATLAGDYLSTGDVGFSRLYTERIQQVTAEQVRAMARRYLDPGAMVVTRMLPAATAAAEAAEKGGRRTDRTERFVLDNGLTVVLSTTDSVDLVAMNVAVLGGVMVETDATNGLGTLMASLSTRGAGDRTAEEIAAFFDAAGGAIGGISGNNTFLWSAQVLKDDAPEALDVLADVVIRPTFPEGELAIYRPGLLSAIDQIDEDWSSQMRLHFRRSFFAGSPYRFDPLGTAGVVAAADRDAIAAHHRRWVRAASAVLTVYGNFDLEAMKRRVIERFADMPAGANTIDAPAPRTVDGPERHVLPTGNQVAAIMIGYPGMTFADTADRDAITVLDTIISGYQLPSGWLHTQLRGSQLVYVVHAYNWVGCAPGSFVIYAATQPQTAQRVVDTITETIRRTLTHEFTQAEIDQAVNTILTADLLGSQTMAELSAQAALDELYGVGYDYSRSLAERLGAVTPEDLRRVARRYLAGPPVVTLTLPQAEAETAGN